MNSLVGSQSPVWRNPSGVFIIDISVRQYLYSFFLCIKNPPLLSLTEEEGYYLGYSEIGAILSVPGLMYVTSATVPGTERTYFFSV